MVGQMEHYAGTTESRYPLAVRILPLLGLALGGGAAAASHQAYTEAVRDTAAYTHTARIPDACVSELGERLEAPESTDSGLYDDCQQVPADQVDHVQSLVIKQSTVYTLRSAALVFTAASTAIGMRRSMRIYE